MRDRRARPLLAVFTVLVGSAWAPTPARADFSSCATSWSNFTGPDGFVAEYTYQGRQIRDHETSGDPSNGGTGVSPTEIDLASGSSGLNPGPYSTVAFGYYDGGTAWNPDDPATMNDDYILFRWRLGQSPVTGKSDFISRHFNVLFDTDADGYKDYWVDVNGSYQSSGNTDQLQILYDDQNRQDVPDPAGARVAEFSASAATLAGTCGGVAGSPGRSHTRVVNAPDYASTSEVLLEVQVPLSAFKDRQGNQVVFPDSPVAFAYTTSASATDPLQKDFMMDLKFLTLADPIVFGDIVTPSGIPRIEFVNADSRPVSYYTVTQDVYVYLIDPLANLDKDAPECLQVAVTDPASGDDELVTLCETGANTGIFTNEGGLCDPSITYPSPAPVPPPAWLDGLSTSSATVAETWTLLYDAGAGNWIVAGTASGSQPRASQGVPYASSTGGLSFTLYQGAPVDGTTFSFCSLAADRLPTSAAAGSDDDGTLQVAGGNTLYVSYTNRNSLTVTDTVAVLAPCTALVEFTRATGLPSEEFQLTASASSGDKLYVTLTHAEANANPAVVETVTVTLTGSDTQVLTLTETGPDTGVFRNTSGLSTQIAVLPIVANDGLWEDVDRGVVTATYPYACGGTPLTTSASASLFSTPAGGRVGFTNGAGTLDLDLYAPGQAVFVKVTDTTACAGPLTVTVTTSSGDSETLILTQTAVGSGVYMNRTNDLVTTAGSAVVTSASSNFAAMGLVPGGRFVIATGPDVGLYTIASVDSSTQVTLTQALSATRTGISFNARPLMTAVYTGAAPNDGVLEAAHGDTVTVSYLDCNDGDADPANDVKTDTATFNAPPLLINRVLFAPAGSPSCQTELVELLNASSAPVVATGYRIQDEDAELSYTIPDFEGSPLTLQPGERLILSIGGSFWSFYDSGAYYLFLADASYPSNLLGGPGDPDPADQVQLYDPLGRVVDYVGWSATLSNSVDFYGDDSASVLEGTWQDDAFRNVGGMTVGQALSRSADGFDTNRPSDWAFAGDDTCQTILDIYALTRATIRGVQIDPAGVVEFATATQKGTFGFDLYETGRRKGGTLVRLNTERVAAPIHDSLEPIVYRVETVPITLPYVVIEEVDEAGRRHAMGPFEVGEPRAAAALQRVQGRLDAAGGAPRGAAMRAVPGSAWRKTAPAPARESARSTPPPNVPGALRDGVKLYVGGEGVAEVRLADLAPWGLDARLARKGGLRLWNQGREVAYWELPGADARIAFRTEALATDQTGRNVYLLTWGRPAPPMAVPLTRSGPAVTAGFTRVERSAIYLPHAPREADPWLWDILLTGGGAWPYDWWDPSAGNFDLPSLAHGATGTVPVRLHLVGGTRHRHEVRAWINGSFVGVVAFEGARPALLTGSVDAGALQPIGNQLVLEYAAETFDDWDWGLAYVDSLDLGMPLAARNAPVAVDGIGLYEPALPQPPRADYLIVTHGDFLAAARRIAAAKEAEGLRTAIVDVERAYDAFSGGIPEPQAVRALVRRFASAGGLRYVLLVGDDTFDPRDHSGMAARSFVPSLLGWDASFGRIPSENAYADVDGDGRPDVALGRLPVQTAEQAEILADKIAAQATGLARAAGRHLLAVDNQGPTDPSFRAAAEAVLGSLSHVREVAWADLGEGVEQARATLFAALAHGAAVTHYFGHGGPERWADEGLLDVSDAAALAGAQPTVLFTWACQAQWYLNLWGPSINEALLLVPGGGPVASFGPAGISAPAQQRGLSEGVYRGFVGEGLPLGEAIRRAKSGALDGDPSVRGVVEGFNLLGDPALKLPRPDAH